MSFTVTELHGDRAEQYRQLADQAEALVTGETDRIANAANISALIYHALTEVNWVGFYFFDGHELVVGPFQGKPACVRIALGKGVCGTAAATQQTQLVPDVHAFAGHIACDAETRSEIVVPLVLGGELVGVLDLDSPAPDRFDEADRHGLEAIAEVFLRTLGDR
ncbi:GAF domain-containing protein [Antrihabitans sp. YC2-6]|uniref:GAF domain-containing protein n=1 Tax=Antrihabitans sp. YC2-6 TaxID=2799498 RepID=UPI0018F5D0CB|nr:GAF domain-containing protein [Antrihabitans sp. YC2-6]MBJ8344293.1 GAF domain-containing protein [Antrihabitans sp. YC2-6]